MSFLGSITQMMLAELRVQRTYKTTNHDQNKNNLHKEITNLYEDHSPVDNTFVEIYAPPNQTNKKIKTNLL
jgi:hypothetical protein